MDVFIRLLELYGVDTSNIYQMVAMIWNSIPLTVRDTGTKEDLLLQYAPMCLEEQGYKLINMSEFWHHSNPESQEFILEMFRRNGVEATEANIVGHLNNVQDFLRTFDMKNIKPVFGNWPDSMDTIAGVIVSYCKSLHETVRGIFAGVHIHDDYLRLKDGGKNLLKLNDINTLMFEGLCRKVGVEDCMYMRQYVLEVLIGEHKEEYTPPSMKSVAAHLPDCNGILSHLRMPEIQFVYAQAVDLCGKINSFSMEQLALWFNMYAPCTHDLKNFGLLLHEFLCCDTSVFGVFTVLWGTSRKDVISCFRDLYTTLGIRSTVGKTIDNGLLALLAEKVGKYAPRLHIDDLDSVIMWHNESLLNIIQ